MSTSAASQAAAIERCAALRKNFDEAFARPFADTTESMVDLLTVRIGGDPYALRLAEVAGVHVNLHVVALPEPAPHLLGIAAIRGVMAPIYDLAGLLGYPPAPSARWVAMAHAAHPVGLALECLEAHLRVPDRQGSASNLHARDAVQAGGALRPILQIGALIHSIEEQQHDG